MRFFIFCASNPLQASIEKSSVNQQSKREFLRPSSLTSSIYAFQIADKNKIHPNSARTKSKSITFVFCLNWSACKVVATRCQGQLQRHYIPFCLYSPSLSFSHRCTRSLSAWLSDFMSIKLVRGKSNGRKIHLFFCYVHEKINKANKNKITVACLSVRNARVVDSIIIIDEKSLRWEHMSACRIKNTSRIYLLFFSSVPHQVPSTRLWILHRIFDTFHCNGIVTHTFSANCKQLEHQWRPPSNECYLQNYKFSVYLTNIN